MSLLDALGAAASGLTTSQAAISVVSKNVANAQNANYADRSAVVAELPDASGVQIASIQRATDQAVQQASLAQSSQAAGDAALSTLYQQLENVTGGSSDTPLLSNAVSQFQSAWQSYEATPADSAAEQAVVQAGTGLTQALATTAGGVQQLQATAQGNVATGVSTLNADLATIAQLNSQIVAAVPNSASLDELQDQQSAAVAAVAQLVSIQTVERPDGSVSVYTPNGLALVSATPASFSWNGTNITLTGTSTSLNSSFASGSIGATLGFIATDSASAQSSNPNVGTLQKLTDQLNAFAQSFYDTAAVTPPAFEAAYDDASPAQSGELASSFFTTSDGAAAANALDLAVNPDLLNGTSQVKAAAATPVVAALTQSNQSLDAGGLSVSGQTYASIANAIIATGSSNAETASNNATSSAAISSTLSQQLSSATGVNMDSEMANLIVLQNAYGAAARVVTTVNSMLSTLMTIGQ